MRINNKLFALLLMFAVLFSCEREYEAPPLTEPTYEGANANITIAKLKSLYENISKPTLIDVDYRVKANVIGNDISGNIYKQVYIQDETGGINIGVDQNSIYTEFRVGQEVYINLKGLYMVKYGEQLQIGYDKTQANRIPWEIFTFHTFKNKWPQADKVEPTPISLSNLEQSQVNMLVKLENVYFEGGGKLPFSEADATTNRILKDASGTSIIVRNSNYANFAATMLPEGAGTVVGVLSKFRSDWQILLRTVDDCMNFGQPIPGSSTTPDKPVEGKTYFKETFGEADVSARPLIADYTGFDNKDVKFSDPSGSVSIRTTKTFSTPHLWFPAGKDGYLKMENIDTSAGAGEELALSYEITANLFDAGSEMNLNAMTVNIDGKDIAVPSQVVSNAKGDNNKVYTIVLKGVPAKKGLTIQFWAKSALNTVGLRLDNISIITAPKETIVIKPNN